MLTIPNGQLRALQERSRGDFNKRAYEYLRRKYPHAHFNASGQSLARFLDAAVRKAHEYDVEHEVDVLRFIEVIIAIGGNFEVLPEFSWITDYLREPIRAELRLDYICERLRFGVGRVR